MGESNWSTNIRQNLTSPAAAPALCQAARAPATRLVETSISLPTSRLTPLTLAVAYLSHQAASRSSAAENIGFVRRVVDGGRLGPGAGAQVENLLDQLDQVVDAEIVDRVFQRGKQAEVAAEADDVPGVDERTAFDAALEQVLDLGKVAGDGIELMGVDRLVAGGEQAIDLAQHAGRGDPHRMGLLERRVGIAHAGVELGQVHVLHLRGAAAGQLVVQMLPGAAERLARALRFGPQPFAVLVRGARQQILVELVAIGGDVRQQSRERDVGAVAAGPLPVVPEAIRIVPASTAAASNMQLVARGGGGSVFAAAVVVGRRIHPRQQRIERDLLQHEAAIVAAVVDVVQVPLAEVVVGPLAGRVIEVVGARIERQLFDQLRIEPGLLQDLRIGVGENRQRPLDQLLVRARGHADVVDVQRNRPQPLVAYGSICRSDSSTATGR